MKKSVLIHVTEMVLLSCLLCVILMPTSCKNNAAKESEALIEGKILSYNDFGAAMLSLTEDDMEKAGFTPGDVVALSVKDTTIEMPYYDGFYALTGEYICVAYSAYPTVCFTANNTGVPESLKGLEGERVIVRMKEKGGKVDTQEAMSMSYTNNRDDYSSDVAFANARAVKGGRIVSGRLHRSSSPFSNEINRAAYVSEYLEKQQVKTVLNLTDDEEKMKSYDMPPYSRTLWEGGNVILCPLKADPTADDFNNPLIAALKEMASRPGPYLVHCTEGKDRTGYVCALLAGLCGASYEEIVNDYLITYDNYYHVNPTDNKKACDALLLLRLNPCLRFYAGVDDDARLPAVDYRKSFSEFLLSHGMNRQELDKLIQEFTVE